MRGFGPWDKCVQYCEVLRHVLLHVIMSMLCFVEMTDVTSEHLLSCVTINACLTINADLSLRNEVSVIVNW